MKKRALRCVAISLLLCVGLATLPAETLAATGRTEVIGQVYEFDKDNDYEFSIAEEYSPSNSTDTYGSFSISGDISSVSEIEGVPSYEVSSGSLSFFYSYGDNVLNAEEDDWHLVDDKSKKLDTMTLDENILKGVIVVQTSKDRLTWVNVDVDTNAFADVPVRTNSIYTSTDVQLINGCYYRVIVAYELRIRTDETKILFVDINDYDHKKVTEVYEFYAYSPSDVAQDDLSQIYNLGSKVRVAEFDGYYGEKEIDENDAHYGWDLGKFFVSGYTDEVIVDNGSVVFLKNVGDKVTLWFNLGQNLDGLNGNPSLSITADSEGYDQYFETPRINFGRGTLIIRYTDHHNVTHDPVIYTNYLEANATVGADTKVQLFEEGDYEVALDYEVTNDKIIDSIGHYRIYFKFSVRNGNCMAYPFDVVTGSELTNSSLTENGFRLDLARSRYLKVNISREVLTASADGLVEDTRFNGPAKDGAEYTEEGIYTISVHNVYTNQLTVKRIYVGTNNVLRAHMTTGLSIPEINELVASGATIEEDGTMRLAAVQDEPVEDDTVLDVEESLIIDERIDDSKITWVVVAIVLVVVCLAGAIVLTKKTKNRPEVEEESVEEE